MSRILILLISLAVFTVHGAVPEEVKGAVPNAAEVGQAKFTYYFWDVYTATLYSTDGEWPAQRFALKLDYLRDFKGKKIAERSIKEMRSQGLDDKDKIQQWSAAMQQIFPDIEDGEHLVGVVGENSVTRFYQDGKELGKVDDPAFATWFFNIWLGPKTSEPELREKLLSGANP